MTDDSHVVGGRPVRFDTDAAGHAYLDRFHTRATGLTDELPAVEVGALPATDGRPDADLWPVVVRSEHRPVTLLYPGRSAVDALRLGARNHWLATLPPTAVVLPATALRIGARVVLFTGSPRSGKTSLLLDGLVGHGAEALAYDALVLDIERGHGTAVPSIMNVRSGTLVNVPGVAAALAPHQVGLDLSAPDERYFLPGAFPVTSVFPLAEEPILVVSAGFAAGPATLSDLSPAEATATLRGILEHWPGYREIDRAGAALGVDSARGRAIDLAGHLVAMTRPFRLRHHGCPHPVLVPAGPGATRPCRTRWLS